MATRRTVPVSKRDVAKASSSGGANVKRGETQLTTALAAAPVVPEDQNLAQLADYYRDGHYELNTGTNGQQVVEKVLPAKTLAGWFEQPASIRVYGKGTGKPNTGEDKNGKKERDFIPPYTKFIIESIQEGHTERSQIIETFGESFVFFFGQRPPVYTFSGTLINSKNANWLADFHYYYENHLRGTRCVEKNARLILTYGGRQIEGFILNIGTQTNAATEQGIPFTFQCLVLRRNNVSFSDDFGIETEQMDPDPVIDSIAGKAGNGLFDSITSEAWNHTKGVMDQASAAAEPTQYVDKVNPFSNV